MKSKRLDGEKAQVVELLFFGGLSVEETTEVLKVATDAQGLLATFLVSQVLGNCFQRGRLEKILGVLAIEKEGMYFLPQAFIWPARCVEKHFPLRLVVFQGSVIQALNLPQALIDHITFPLCVAFFGLVQPIKPKHCARKGDL